MVRVTIDSATQAKLQGEGPLEVCNEGGKVLGYYYPLPIRIKSPISDEEVRRRAQQLDGALPLSEVLKKLGQP